MPIFQHKGRLHQFAHVPKCGGSSVENMLTERFGTLAFLDRSYLRRKPAFLRWSRSSPQHITWDEFRRVVPEDWITSAFVVVRHPLARVVSAYHHAYTRGYIPGLQSLESWFHQSITLMETDIGLFDRHLLPQVDFLPDSAEVFQLENGLNAVSDWLDATFGVSGQGGLPHELQSSRKIASDVARRTPTKVSSALRDRVADYYARDFARLGYDPYDPDTANLDVYTPRPAAYGLRAHARLAKTTLMFNTRISLIRMNRELRTLQDWFNG